VNVNPKESTTATGAMVSGATYPYDRVCETLKCNNPVAQWSKREGNISVQYIYAHCEQCRKDMPI